MNWRANRRNLISVLVNGEGEPCGDSFISADKTCRIGGGEFFHGSPNKTIEELKPNANGVLFLTADKEAAKFHANIPGEYFKSFKAEQAGSVYSVGKLSIKNPRVVSQAVFDDVTNDPDYIKESREAGHDAIATEDGRTVAVFERKKATNTSSGGSVSEADALKRVDRQAAKESKRGDDQITVPFPVEQNPPYGKDLPKLFKMAKPSEVDVKTLIATQKDKSVDVDAVKSFIRDPHLAEKDEENAGDPEAALPWVIKKGGKHYIGDGHHRFTALFYRGVERAPAMVTDLDGNRALKNAGIGQLIPFQEALDALTAKGIVPADLSSDEWSNIDAAIRERAFFSARTTNAIYLQKVKDTIDAILNPVSVMEDGKRVTRGMGTAEARVLLRDTLQDLGYEAPEGKAGGIQDLSSEARLNLIVRTQTDMARGYGKWIQGQTEGALDGYPAWELYRGESRIEPRNWPERWEQAGGEFYPGESDYPEGRMIALKNSPIWVEISEFDQPYPPFDFNSGMWIRPVDRATCEELGIMQADEEMPAAQSRGLEDVQAGVEGIDADLQQQLLQDLGSGYDIVSGIVKLMNRAADLILNAGCGAGDAGAPGFQPGNVCAKGDGGPNIGTTTRAAAKVVREHQQKAKAGIAEGPQTQERLKAARAKYNEYLKRNAERRKAKAANEPPPPKEKTPEPPPPEVSATGATTKALQERAKALADEFEARKAARQARRDEREEKIQGGLLPVTPGIKKLKLAVEQDQNPEMKPIAQEAGGIKGINGTYIAKFKVRNPDGSREEIKTIYKPDDEAHIGARGEVNDRQFTGSQREEVTHAIANKIGVETYPAVHRAPVKGRVGSVMTFVPGTQKFCDIPDDEKKKLNPKQMAQIAFLDVVTGNSDRHGRNLLTKGETPIPIDHGLILPERSGKLGGNASRASEWMGKHLPNDKVDLAKADTKRMLEKVKSQEFKGWIDRVARKQGMDKRSVDTLYERLAVVEKHMESHERGDVSYRGAWRAIHNDIYAGGW